MVDLFKVLADESRLRIINLLRHQEVCVCEIEAILGTSQSNISRHLARLRHAGLVTYDKRAQWIYYRVSVDFVKRYPLIFETLNQTMDQTPGYRDDLSALADYRSGGLSCDSPNQAGEVK